MREHKRRANELGWLLSGVAIGTALGWLTAPRRGGWMRNQARQKLAHWSRTGAQRLRKRGRDLGNRIQGGVAEIRETWGGREHYVDANTLVDQVRSELGRGFAAEMEHVNVNAVGHTIYLHGYVHEEEQRERLLAAIRGAEEVEDVQASELRVQPPPPPHAAPEALPESDVRQVSAPAPAARSRRRTSERSS
ncbi:MAG: BON domain-containing protein [Terriglobales bacterium]